MKTKSINQNGKLEIKNNIDTMQKMLESIFILHSEIKHKMANEQELQINNIAQRNFKVNELYNEFSGLRSFFQGFSQECKNQWTTVYQELLSIINNVVELYQIKVAKLQDIIDSNSKTIENQSRLIQQLRRNKDIQKLFTQGYDKQNESDCKYMNELEQSIYLSNSKKVKVSDVIASYKSSVMSSHSNIEVLGINQNICNIPSQNNQISSKKFLKFDQNESAYRFFKNDQGQSRDSIQELQIAAPLSRYNKSRSDNKALNSSLDQKQNFPSYVSSCRKLSQIQESKQNINKSGRLRNKEGKELKQCSNTSKLCQLRRYLYNRK